MPDHTNRTQRSISRRKALEVVALVCVLIAIVGVIGAATGALPLFGQQGSARCWDLGAPACPGTPNTWVHLASTAPADVIAAMQSCPDYGTPLQRFGFEPGTPYSFPDAPVLVKPATSGAGDGSLPHSSSARRSTGCARSPMSWSTIHHGR